MDFAEIFHSDGTIVSISMHLPSFLPKNLKSGLFACISLSVWIGLSQIIVTTRLDFVTPADLPINVYYECVNVYYECVLLTCCTRTCTLLLLILIA